MVGETGRHAVAAACLLVLALGTAGAGAAGAQSTGTESVITVGDATVEPNATTTVVVSLDEAPAGISGFNLTVNVADSSVATITDISIGGSFSTVGGETGVASDGASAVVDGVDFGESVQPGATDVTLATVTVSGVEAGSTTLDVSSESIDDDDGSEVETTAEAGTVTVESTGSEGEDGSDDSSNDDDGSGNDDSSSDDTAGNDGSDDAAGNESSSSDEATSENETSTSETASGGDDSSDEAATETPDSDDDTDDGSDDATPTETAASAEETGGETETTGESGPGFTVGTGVVVLLAVGVVASRRAS